VTKYETCTEYWWNTETGEFRGEFESMYRDIADPWGCEAHRSSLTNRVFEEIVFDGGRRFDRILDVGCGLGGLLNNLRARNGGGRVLGLDVSETAIQKAATVYPDIEFRCLNLLEHDLDEPPFGLVVIAEVVWCVLADLPLFFDRLMRLMQSGGVLAVHQYFPANQRFGRPQLDGVSGFRAFMTARPALSAEHSLVYEHHDGVVLLATFVKDKQNARI